MPFFEKYKKTILFYWFLYLFILVASREILLKCNMEYRGWVYMVSWGVFIIGFIVGIIQLILRIKKKSIKIIGIIVFIILIMFCSPYVLLFFAVTCEEENIVTYENQKMVTYTQSFWDKRINYYEYINFLVRKRYPKLEEYYGENGEHILTYYNDKGEAIKEENMNE